MHNECGDVTHAYFSSYVHKDDFIGLNNANQAFFENFQDALLATAPKLENCTLQTGGKHYNVHLMPVPSPAREAEERRKSPIGNIYYEQEDYLIKLCIELREEAKMPTNQVYWECYDDVSYSRLIADETIWASTDADTGNQAFNVTNGDYFSWRYMWPRVVDGVVHGQEAVWDRICEKRGSAQAKASWDAATWAFQDRVFQHTWCATLSINKARQLGWIGHIDSFDSFTHAFEKFVELGQIPSFSKNGV
ncbi:uncharacterized protein A1O9_08893 [Exophiala aquamarina CBS 119918]|uniref:PRISE-like Rossmann-fold domain-containing protein n=1 Tax=Exophiala aquamarina CBS 119918 TaxID=1182545 RepID=A0A072P563_9EURO|nr:uncharacterized protein A1O9_08893 [Exophiala aquamarina CBS 119918]KEF55239.1 hypothetical protein A1O9_08893 [Exophiala aquamarina CBS 119918]